MKLSSSPTIHLLTQCRNKKKKQPLDQLINVRLQQPNHCSLCDHVGKYTERKVTTVEYIKKNGQGHLLMQCCPICHPSMRIRLHSYAVRCTFASSDTMIAVYVLTFNKNAYHPLLTHRVVYLSSSAQLVQDDDVWVVQRLTD